MNIACVRDSHDIVRTNDDNIRKALRSHRQKMFDREQDVEDIENLTLTEDLNNGDTISQLTKPKCKN